jgi:hypothetical protein
MCRITRETGFPGSRREEDQHWFALGRRAECREPLSLLANPPDSAPSLAGLGGDQTWRRVTVDAARPMLEIAKQFRLRPNDSNDHEDQ